MVMLECLWVNASIEVNSSSIRLLMMNFGLDCEKSNDFILLRKFMLLLMIAKIRLLIMLLISWP